jgi:hypothetical protein
VHSDHTGSPHSEQPDNSPGYCRVPQNQEPNGPQFSAVVTIRDREYRIAISLGQLDGQPCAAVRFTPPGAALPWNRDIDFNNKQAVETRPGHALCWPPKDYHHSGPDYVGITTLHDGRKWWVLIRMRSGIDSYDAFVQIIPLGGKKALTHPPEAPLDPESLPSTIPSPAQIAAAAKGPYGGWTKAQLAQWGVPWPPPRVGGSSSKRSGINDRRPIKDGRTIHE